MTKNEEVIRDTYKQFKKDMNAKYNWAVSEGEFVYILQWIVGSNVLMKLGSKNNGRR